MEQGRNLNVISLIRVSDRDSTLKGLEMTEKAAGRLYW